jgi:hypothetical protein
LDRIDRVALSCFNHRNSSFHTRARRPDYLQSFPCTKYPSRQCAIPSRVWLAGKRSDRSVKLVPYHPTRGRLITIPQCIHNDRPPCKRCKDRGENCIFPAPGTSSIHRQPKLRQSFRRSIGGAGGIARNDGVDGIGDEVSQLLNPSGAGYDLSRTNPYDLFSDEVKNSYLRCSYKWSFHHIPSLLLQVRKHTLDQGVIWSILALAIRFSNDAPPPFSAPIEASNAFAAHARSIVLPAVEEPTLHRIQALLMITGHSWGAGEGHRAWMYLGMAVRMAQVVGLFDEPLEVRDREDFIATEEKRRTAWTCFLMDSLLSGGKRRRRALSADDMHVQLPCDTDFFHFGEPVRCELIDGTFSPLRSDLPVGNLGIVAHSMRVADVWGSVARWACSLAVEGELPWEDESEFQRLLKSLDLWRKSLPHRLQFNILSLHAHSASNQGQAYCYMHSIYFMSIMFLHRSYLQGNQEDKHESDSPLDQKWRQWQAESRRELLLVTDEVCDMYEEMRDFGLYFLRGLVPWIGFTVYTAVGVMLYYHHFPDDDDDQEVLRRGKDRVVNGCAFLKDMRGSWPMADSWVRSLVFSNPLRRTANATSEKQLNACRSSTQILRRRARIASPCSKGLRCSKPLWTTEPCNNRLFKMHLINPNRSTLQMFVSPCLTSAICF